MTPTQTGDKPMVTQPCEHLTKITAAGIKVCFDCGEPLNKKAKEIAAMKRRQA